MRAYKTQEWFRERADQGNFENLDALFSDLSGYMGNEYKKNERRNLFNYTQLNPPYTSMHEVLELWTNDRVIILVDRQHVIRNEPNPYGYQPFIRIVDQNIPLEFYGIGEVEGQEDHQLSANDLRNQFMQTSFNISQPSYICSRFADINSSQLVARPSGRIDTDDMAGIQPLRINPQLLNILLQAEGTVKEDMERRSGVFDLIRGERTRGEETATEILSRGENANARFGLKTQLLEYLFLETLGEMWGDMCQQFMREEKVEAIVKEDATKFIRVSPEQIKGRFLYVPTANTISEAQKMVDRRDLLQIFQLAAQTGRLNVDEALLTLLNYFPVKNKEKFLLPPQPVGLQGSPNPQNPQPQEGEGQGGENPINLTSDIVQNLLSKFQGGQ